MTMKTGPDLNGPSPGDRLSHAVSSIAQHPSMNPAKKKILIVDDNAVVVRALSMKLKASGYDTLTAQEGSEAVSAVRQQKPDLIVLDINFPPDVAHGGGIGWDGFRIMEWLRRINEAKGTPVIIITGGDPAKYKDAALAAGAVSFFQKPINNDELLAVIQKLLAQPAEAAQPPA
jgi:CheY-like chemotaxis protein